MRSSERPTSVVAFWSYDSGMGGSELGRFEVVELAVHANSGGIAAVPGDVCEVRRAVGPAATGAAVRGVAGDELATALFLADQERGRAGVGFPALVERPAEPGTAGG